MAKKKDTPGHRLLPWTREIRRDFHRHPEIGMQEKRTKKRVRDLLAESRIRSRSAGGTGLLADLSSPEPGPTLMLRADMDALPVTEENVAPYCSEIPGLMHACGHDGHMAVLLGAARELAEARVPRGRVRLCFQPGEEGFKGAQGMIDDGALEGVDAAFGLHLWRDVPVGRIAVLDGPCMAAVDTFTITITGRGGHAAYPHLSTDPVLIAAHVVTALQSIVSRRIDPIDTAVVTVGSIDAGTSFNIIPQAAVLRGTCRTFTRSARKTAHSQVVRIAKGITRSLGGRAEVDYVEFLPPTVNDPGIAELVREAAAEVVGRKNVVDADPSMGGEDMSLYLERVPGCFAFVGLRNKKRGIDYPHHHPRFDLDEDCLAVGVDLMLEVTGRYLGTQ